MGAFPVCTAGFQQLIPDWPSVMSQKLLHKIQTTTPTHPPPSTRSASACAAWGEENLVIPRASPPLSKIPPPLWRGWEGQGEGKHEMAHEDKQGVQPFWSGLCIETPQKLISGKRGLSWSSFLARKVCVGGLLAGRKYRFFRA